MKAPIYLLTPVPVQAIKESIEFVEKSSHLHDCCEEYNDDTRKYEKLPDDQCWCGRTELLKKLRRILNAG